MSESHSVAKKGQADAEALSRHLGDVIAELEQWACMDGSPGKDVHEVQSWKKLVRHLSRATRRPPTIGVYGQSHSGKSFLISGFSGSGPEAEILVRDPQFEADGQIEAQKPWGDSVRQRGGLSFLKYVNAENPGESTGIACRFTHRPVDLPAKPDCMVGQLMSHEDILISLALGFLMEYEQVNDASALADRYEKILDQARQGSVSEDDGRLGSLYHAWDTLSQGWRNSAHIEGLHMAGYDGFIQELIRNRQMLTDQAWNQLVGLLWGGPKVTALQDLYLRLVTPLAEIGFPRLVDIPISVVCRSHRFDRPITDVKLLDSLFSDDVGDTVEVWSRTGAGAEAGSWRVRRSLLTGVIAELTLPVAKGEDPDGDLLGHADILDFPGSRAPQGKYCAVEDDADTVRLNALWAYRQGKLHRLFTSLVEQREISALCLVAPAEPLESTAVVERALREWLAVHEMGAQSIQGAPLLLAVTKADRLLSRPAAEHRFCRFGHTLSTIRRAYSASGGKPWMDQWSSECSSFTRTFWVRNPEFAVTGLDDEAYLAHTRKLYESSEMVSTYVADLKRRLESLIEGKDVDGVIEELISMTSESDKYERLHFELSSLVRDIRYRLVNLHHDKDDSEKIALARGEAVADTEAIRLAWPGGTIEST